MGQGRTTDNSSRRVQYKALQQPTPFVGIESPAADPMGLIDRWHPRVSEILRQARRFSALQASGSFDALDSGAPAEEITSDKWASLWPDRVPGRARLRAASQQAFLADDDAFTRPEQDQLDKWYAPFPDWHARRRTHPTRAPAHFAWSEPPAAPAEDVTADKWLGVWPDRVPARARLRAAAQAAFWPDPDALTRPEATSLDRWYGPFAEPLRARRRAPDVGLSALDPFPLPPAPPETITLDKWWRPLAEPTRRSPPLAPRAPWWFPDPETPVAAEPPDPALAVDVPGADGTRYRKRRTRILTINGVRYVADVETAARLLEEAADHEAVTRPAYAPPAIAAGPDLLEAFLALVSPNAPKTALEPARKHPMSPSGGTVGDITRTIYRPTEAEPPPLTLAAIEAEIRRLKRIDDEEDEMLLL